METLSRFAAAAWSALTLHASRYGLEWGLAAIAVASIGYGVYGLVATPTPFPIGEVVVVREGASASAVVSQLAEAGVVRRAEVLRLYWRVAGGGATIPAGAYRFSTPQNVFTIARRLTRGEYGIPPIRVTFPEGATVLDMSKRVEKAFPEISATEFISAAGPYEGYLYPDTYVFSPSATAASVVAKARATFADKLAPLAGDIANSGHSLSDIVIMASILEREAAREDDRRMVAGVLWNRVDRGMPLQVDAVFGYINSRQTYSPSYRDLGVDSPYNTYKNKGLPPGPISNPSLSAIMAALHPASTKYLFYLTGRDGLMHYATTYAGHKANLAAYLR